MIWIATRMTAKARSLFLARRDTALGSHAGVDDDVEEIDEKVHEHEACRHHEDGGLDQRIIALGDGAEDQAPEAGDGEDLLDDDGAAEKIAGHDADTGEERNQRIAQ